MGVLRIVIVGAGVSGLAAAHRLLELCLAAGIVPNLRVLEAGPRPGGLIRTRREKGFLWEDGPDSFITDKPWALDLCKRLGLDQELIGAKR
ncbi:MAG: FAD-dependent oxidoreductase [Elusimicrobiota bacterium]